MKQSAIRFQHKPLRDDQQVSNPRQRLTFLPEVKSGVRAIFLQIRT